MMQGAKVQPTEYPNDSTLCMRVMSCLGGPFGTFRSDFGCASAQDFSVKPFHGVERSMRFGQKE